MADVSQGEFFSPPLSGDPRERFPTVARQPTAGRGLRVEDSGVVNPRVLGTGGTDGGSTKFLREDGTYATPAYPAGGATTATTVSGLGTASDGKIGFLRMGSSPYDHQLVIYDATRAKWVSPTERFQILSYTGVTQSASTSATWLNYVYLSNNVAGLMTYFYPGNPRITAGLQPELRLTVELDWGATGSATSLAVRPMIFSSSEGGTPTAGTAGTFTNAAPANFSGANLRQIRRGAWAAADSTVSTSGDWWEFGLAANPTYTGSGTINWHSAVVEIRWVG